MGTDSSFLIVRQRAGPLVKALVRQGHIRYEARRAAGWKCVGQVGGLRWTGKRRPEVDLYPAQTKIRFEKEVHA